MMMSPGSIFELLVETLLHPRKYATMFTTLIFEVN